MSERIFFTLRYAAPGYTFILVALLVAFPKVKDILLGSNIGEFLAFFSLLGGMALGFLISQFWYIIDFRYNRGRYGELPKLREYLRKCYHLKLDINHEILFIDYITHCLCDKKMVDYAWRRFDLMHTCASTLLATIFGSIFGFLIGIGCFSSFTPLSIQFLSYLTMYDLMAIIIVTILIIVLMVNFLKMREEHARVIYFAVMKVVESGKFPSWKAREAFPPPLEYFSGP